MIGLRESFAVLCLVYQRLTHFVKIERGVPLFVATWLPAQLTVRVEQLCKACKDHGQQPEHEASPPHDLRV